MVSLTVLMLVGAKLEETQGKLEEAQTIELQEQGRQEEALKLLESSQEHLKRVGKIIALSLTALTRKGVEINRELWLKDAVEVEKSGATITCQAIVHQIIEQGIEVEDRKHAWIEDADTFITNGAYECARAVYAHALQVRKANKVTVV